MAESQTLQAESFRVNKTHFFATKADWRKFSMNQVWDMALWNVSENNSFMATRVSKMTVIYLFWYPELDVGNHIWVTNIYLSQLAIPMKCRILASREKGQQNWETTKCTFDLILKDSKHLQNSLVLSTTSWTAKGMTLKTWATTKWNWPGRISKSYAAETSIATPTLAIVLCTLHNARKSRYEKGTQ